MGFLYAFVILFMVADAAAYWAAKYPERTKNIWYRLLPGGGFVALLKLGR